MDENNIILLIMLLIFTISNFLHFLLSCIMKYKISVNMSIRGKVMSSVQDLVIFELDMEKFVFVLHLDGTLQVWDLARDSRVFNHNMGTATMAGYLFPSVVILTFLFLYIHLSNLFH